MVGTVTPEALAELLRLHPEQYALLDVREDDERAIGHIEPSVHIPMNQVPQRLSDVPKDRTLVVYCHHGTRSMMVAGYLEGQGYKGVMNLDGGIDAWSRRVDRSVARYS